MDKSVDSLGGKTLRDVALSEIDNTRFVPKMGQNRLRGMIEGRPDWVLSRQRAWGVPIAVFYHKDTGQVIPGVGFEHNDELVSRITSAFEAEGADAWFVDGAKEKFLNGLVENMDDFIQVKDILDVWFDSGSTHAFCLEERDDMQWPADLYLEGSDQHRGWFHSSLLESCGTRGQAPYKAVLTHGFTMAEDGRKMSKSLGNQVAPQQIIQQYGADILRLWVASCDYSEDQRIGDEIIKTSVDAYRKMRNTLRWMLGTLSHFEGETVTHANMPELERLMLHRLVELDKDVRKSYDEFDFKRVFSQLFNFMTVELSAFYFDIRKDALYCDAPSSERRKASLYVVSQLFDCLVKWFAPIMPFTMEETWMSLHGEDKTVHLEQFPDVNATWLDDSLAAKWAKIRAVRKVVTGALEVERVEKRIRSSLEGAPEVYISDKDLLAALEDQAFEDICITSSISVIEGDAPADSFTLDEVAGVGVVPKLAEGTKCARSWKVLPEVGTDSDYLDVTLRDANALREIDGK
jgi:isoleucyl-tRNA synthetase